MNMHALLSSLFSIGASVALARPGHVNEDFKGRPDGDLPPITQPGKWSKYETLILAHALLAMVTFWVAVPMAALIGRFGRDSRNWIKWHRGIQAGWTTPVTIAIVILGLVAAGTQGSIFKPWDIHHIIGVILLLLIIIQAYGGFMANRSPLRKSTEVNARPAMRVIHPVLGVLIAVLSWVQTRLGLSEYGYESMKLDVLNAVLVGSFLIAYAYGLACLVIERKAAGRSWFNAMFGLGRASASSPPRI